MGNFFVLKQEKKFLIFVFFLSFLIRFLFFVFFLSKEANYSTYDTHQYHDVAVQIVNGNGISNVDGSPHFYRLPGYSIFLACCYKIFNTIDIKIALFVQLFFACFIPILIFLLSMILFPLNILLAKIVSILSVFHLGLIIFSGYAMTETLFLIFFLLFLILFLKSFNLFWCKFLIDKKSKKNFFIAGIFLGIAFMFRPVGHYVLILGLFLLLVSNLDWLSKIRNGAMFFIGWFVAVSPWLIRNFLLTGAIFFHTLPGVHFLKHSAARILSEINQTSYSQSLSVLMEEVDEIKFDKEINANKAIGINDIEYCLIAEKVTSKYLKKDLFITFKHFATNILKTCFGLYSSELLYIDSGGKLPEYSNSRSLLALFSRFLFPEVNNKLLIPLIYYEIILFLFLCLGFIFFIIRSFFYKDDFCVLLKVIPFIGLFLVITLSCGFARLRLPIEPFLIILSFKFWIDVLRRRKKPLWKKT